jgi:hypothetical protein
MFQCFDYQTVRHHIPDDYSYDNIESETSTDGVAYIGKKRNAYRFLVGKPEETIRKVR